MSTWIEEVFDPTTLPLDVLASGVIDLLSTVDPLSSVKAASLRFTGATPTLAGLVPQVDGQRIHLFAVGGPLTIANEASAVPANCIRTGTGAALVVPQDGAVQLVYDSSSSRWRVAGRSSALVGARSSVKPSILGELQTSTTGGAVTPLASYTMVDESFCAFDVIVTMARRGNVTKAARYKRSVCYRRTGGGAPTIVGAIENGTDQETTAADDATISVSGNVVRVMVTAADADGRNWTCELRVQETLAT